MRFLSKCCLSMALLASISLVGCGGGGSDNNSSGPAPVPSIAEATAATAAVKPVFANANTILNGGPTTASARYALGEVETLNFDTISNTVNDAMNVGNFMRMVLDIGGGNINSGLFMNEGTDSSKESYCYTVAKFEGDTYEKTVYRRKHGDQNTYVAANYWIKGCSATVKDNVLTSLTINKDAKFVINNNKWNSEFFWRSEQLNEKDYPRKDGDEFYPGMELRSYSSYSGEKYEEAENYNQQLNRAHNWLNTNYNHDWPCGIERIGLIEEEDCSYQLYKIVLRQRSVYGYNDIEKYDSSVEGTINGGITIDWKSDVKTFDKPIVLDWDGKDITSTTDSWAYGFLVNKEVTTTVKTSLNNDLSVTITKAIQNNHQGAMKKL